MPDRIGQHIGCHWCYEPSYDHRLLMRTDGTLSRVRTVPAVFGLIDKKRIENRFYDDVANSKRAHGHRTRHWPYVNYRNVCLAAHYGRINRGRFSFQDHCIDVGHRLYPNFKDTVLGSSITDDSLQGSLCKDNAMVLPEWWSDKLVEGFNLKENRRFAICHLKTSSLLG